MSRQFQLVTIEAVTQMWKLLDFGPIKNSAWKQPMHLQHVLMLGTPARLDVIWIYAERFTDLLLLTKISQLHSAGVVKLIVRLHPMWPRKWCLQGDLNCNKFRKDFLYSAFAKPTKSNCTWIDLSPCPSESCRFRAKSRAWCSTKDRLQWFVLLR